MIRPSKEPFDIGHWTFFICHFKHFVLFRGFSRIGLSRGKRIHEIT